MRYLRFIAVISLLLVASNSYACFNPWYSELEYSIYRIEDKESDTPSKRMANLMEWQAMTSPEISIEDIEKIVYNLSLEEFEVLYKAERYSGTNAFMHWIKSNDEAIMDFLLLAKRNEHIRFQYNSLWYYPSMKIKGPTTLEEIVELSLSNKDSRLRHRYLLQAMRALYTLNRYEECMALWNEEFDTLDKNHTMRRHAHMYMAGALYHTGDVEQALTEYAEIGDIDSIVYISKLEGLGIDNIALMELLYRNNTDNSEVLSMLFNKITYLDDNPFGDAYDVSMNNTSWELSELCDMASRLAADGYEPTFWNYTAAYLHALQGNEAEARKAIAKADKCKCSPFMSDSIEVMKIYIDAKFSPLDKRYDSTLFKQMRWLNEKIKEHSPAVAKEYDYDVYYYTYPMSKDYWKTTSQMIINSMLCPRLINEGNEVRALQLANMSSNFTANYINCIHHQYYDYVTYDWNDLGYHTLDEYRRATDLNNHLDYSSFFFHLANVVDRDSFKAYLDMVEKPSTTFDKYLNECGYVDSSYLNDIMGTRYIRDMQYQKAVEHLAKVKFGYNTQHNLQLSYNPFDISMKRNKVTKIEHDFRLRFAKRMAELERNIAQESDPNRRARMMIDYGFGMISSVSSCWELSYYQNGTVGHVYANHIWYYYDNLEAEKRGYEIINEALEMFTDRELKAEMLYRFGNLYTVGTEFEDTHYGKYVQRHCDNLCDYLVNLPEKQRSHRWYYYE